MSFTFPMRLHSVVFSTWIRHVRWAAGFSTLTTWRVSSHGRVANTRGKIGWGSKRPDGYHRVRVSEDGESRHVLVHRLVARFFIGPPPSPEQQYVNHIDGDPGNNHVDNLEYVTPSQNLLHSYALDAELPRRAGPIPRAVLGRPWMARTWSSYVSCAEASLALDVNKTSIYQCLRGESQLAKGYEFKYVDGEAEDLQEGEEWRYAVDPNNGQLLPGWQVSSFGRVCNTRGVRHWGTKTRNGYHVVRIQGKTYLVHRLVACAFFGLAPADGQRFIHHKDHNPGNNNIQNLQYVTHADNVKYSYASPSSKRGAVRQGKGVLAWDWNAMESKEYESISEAARSLRLVRQRISECCQGRRDTIAGFSFEFMEPLEPDLLPGEKWRQVVLSALLPVLCKSV